MQNPAERPCSECGGQRAVFNTSEMGYRWPEAWPAGGSFLAVICTNCGYTSFYAHDLAGFAKALEKNSAAVQRELQENAKNLAESQNWRNKK